MSMGNIKYEHFLPHHFIDVGCTGNELRLSDCPHNGLTHYSCYSLNDAAIACFNSMLITNMLIFMSCITEYEVQYANCTNGEMRLSGGSSSMSGRTEICYDNVWFGICAGRHSNPYDLNTICRVLGYSNQGNFTCKSNILA